MYLIHKKNIFIGISVALVTISLALIAIFGLRLGIDFKGGALTEVNYPDGRPTVEVVTETIKPLDLGAVLVQPTGDTGFIIKSRDITDAEKHALLETLSGGTVRVEEKAFTSVGPSVGSELTKKAIISLVLVAFGIIIFIAYSFRGVSKPVASWKYGLIAVGTLIHDMLIAIAAFAVFAHFSGVEVDTLFVAAVLTILGLSVSDTIVVFDRIRENLKSEVYPTFKETVGRSIEQTYARSINTSLTVILALLALFFFGPESTKVFSLMLATGMFFGTYSSIFLASPLLVFIQERQDK